eukprot:4621050-Pyramimonas_sp.AAC.1
MRGGRPPWQGRSKNDAAEGDEDYSEEDDEDEEGDQHSENATALAAEEDEFTSQIREIYDQAGDDQELRDELLEGAVFAAAQQGQRSFKQARELLRQKKTGRKFFGGQFGQRKGGQPAKGAGK